MSIQNELNKLKSTKNSIKKAIQDKGISVSDTDPFNTYPNKIASIGGDDGPYYGNAPGLSTINIQESLYNLEENFRKGRVFITPTSGIVTTMFAENTSGEYDFEIITDLFFKESLTETVTMVKYNNGNAEDTDTKYNWENFPVRKYTVLSSTFNWLNGLDISEYKEASDWRNYSYVKVGTTDPSWVTYKPLYELSIKAMDSQGIVINSGNAFTFIQGNSGDVYAESNWDKVFQSWNGAFFYSTVQGLVGYADSYTVTYTGVVYKTWTFLDNNAAVDDIKVANVDDTNTDYLYKEMLPYYECYNWCQKCHKEDGTTGYVNLWYSPPNSTYTNPNMYENTPGSEVQSWLEIYSDIALTNRITDNTGFVYDWECFKTKDPNYTNLWAWKAYEVKNPLNSQTFYTKVAGTQGSSFVGQVSWGGSGVQSPDQDYDHTWYTCEWDNGDVIYVLTTDVTDPVVGGAVPVGTAIYSNRSIYEPSGTVEAEGVLKYKSVTPEASLQYTGVTEFYYQYNRSDHLEPFFSDNPGLYKKNDDNTYTKVDNAYQWMCPGTIDWWSQQWYPNDNTIFYPSNQDTDYMSKVDFSINGYYWWVYKAWKVKSNITNVEAWIPFNFNAVESQKWLVANTECMTSTGEHQPLPENEYWVWEGTFEPNFANRLGTVTVN